MTSQIINSEVVVEDYKVRFTALRKPLSKSLNAIGNFYKLSHQTKQIQRFLEAYLVKSGKPKVGDEIYLDTQPSRITIIKIEENYVRGELEQKLYEIDEVLKHKK